MTPPLGVPAATGPVCGVSSCGKENLALGVSSSSLNPSQEVLRGQADAFVWGLGSPCGSTLVPRRSLSPLYQSYRGGSERETPSVHLMKRLQLYLSFPVPSLGLSTSSCGSYPSHHGPGAQ